MLSLLSAPSVITIIDFLYLVCFSHVCLCMSWPCMWTKPLIPMLCLSLSLSLHRGLRGADCSCAGKRLVGVGAARASYRHRAAIQELCQAALAAHQQGRGEGQQQQRPCGVRWLVSPLLGGRWQTLSHAGCSEAEKAFMYTEWLLRHYGDMEWLDLH